MNTTACIHVTADPSFLKQLSQRFHTGFQRRSVNVIRVNVIPVNVIPVNVIPVNMIPSM